jgi:hypothetical protein
MENLINSISGQLRQIADDFRDEDKEAEPEVSEQSSPKPETAEAPESSEAEPA